MSTHSQNDELRALVDDAMVERATMVLLGHKVDHAPGINWQCNRQWTINSVRQHMRAALEAALTPAAVAGEAELIEAATNASAVLSHIYNTVPMGALENDAFDAYRRLDTALDANKGADHE